MDSIYGGGGSDVLFGLADDDYVNGGSGKDTAYGGFGNDVLLGEGGKDTLNGDLGNDEIHGGGGADSLFGGAGNDTLSGDAGNDRLDGGSGDDTLNGGSGIDRFVFSTGYDTDRVQGYEQGTDRILLDDALWAASGALTSQQVVTNFGSMNAAGTMLTFAFTGGDVLELRNAAGIDISTIAADIMIF
jgi:Ca2+-binding RTX toxin-like protein